MKAYLVVVSYDFNDDSNLRVLIGNPKVFSSRKAAVDWLISIGYSGICLEEFLVRDCCRCVTLTDYETYGVYDDDVCITEIDIL